MEQPDGFSTQLRFSAQPVSLPQRVLVPGDMLPTVQCDGLLGIVWLLTVIHEDRDLGELLETPQPQTQLVRAHTSSRDQ
jgi:hypothetical protein